MLSRRVKQILGIGVIIVVIAGVVFLFTRLNKPVEEPEPMQTTPQFATEETVDNPAFLEEEEERTWEEVVSNEDLWLKTINDTYLFAEPFSDAKTVVKVPINKELDELACCFQGNQSMGWSKVSYNGKTGYVDMKDAEYIIEEEEEEVTEQVEETEGVSEEKQHSIVEVDETAKADEPTETAEPTPTPEPTEEPKAEATPAPSAQPAPTETPNPNVTTKTEAEKQAELQNEVLQDLLGSGGTMHGTIPNGTFGDAKGDGTHYGDLQ